MFCRKCGQKLPINATKCPICSLEIVPNDNCGGFYGIVSSNESIEIKKEIEPTKMAAKQDTATYKPSGKSNKILAIVLVLLIVITIILGIRTFILEKEMRNASSYSEDILNEIEEIIEIQNDINEYMEIQK